MGSVWVHIGVILKSFWDRLTICFWIVLDQFGNLVQSSWNHAGIVLDQVGIVLGSFWGSCWNHVGIILGSLGMNWELDHFGIIWESF